LETKPGILTAIAISTWVQAREEIGWRGYASVENSWLAGWSVKQTANYKRDLMNAPGLLLLHLPETPCD
jgi:hypothetical protein